MGKVILNITDPNHNEPIVGAAAANVLLQGEVVHPQPATLFYKWYSSLYNPPPPGISTPEDAPKAAMNWPNHGPGALTFYTSLPVGTHTIILSAKDIEGDSLADLQQVSEAGMAGGPEVDAEDAAPCVIHVLVASMLTPQPNGITDLTIDNIILDAEAPLKWDDENYQAVNRVRYRWRFEPLGGGAPVTGIPPLDATEEEIAEFQQTLDFIRPGEDGAEHAVPYLRYVNDMSGVLTPGETYDLVLRVEDSNPPHSAAHEATAQVRILAS